MILNSWLLYLNFELPFGLLLPILVTSSQCRLSLHIFIRKRNKKEDWRYENWRNTWGSTFYWRSYLQIFFLQAILNWAMILPLMDLTQEGKLGFLQLLGIIIWLFGTLYEAVGDYQLMKFKGITGNKGKIITSGLWKYSRHPNYFGQIVHWIGIFLIVVGGTHWFVSILSPVLMINLLNYVSGVPMLERKYDDNPTFQAYKQHTPALIPRIF